MTRTWLAVPLGAVLVVCVAAASWWIIGDAPSLGSAIETMNFSVRSPDVSPGVERVIGVSALVLAIAAGLALKLAVPTNRRWVWGVLAPLLVAAVLAAWSWRVFTAGEVPGNVGINLIVFVLPTTAMAVVVAIVFATLPRRSPLRQQLEQAGDRKS